MKDFEQNLKGDPRLAKLCVAQRNFERHSDKAFVKAVRAAELFLLYEHLLRGNDSASIDFRYERDHWQDMPTLYWEVDNSEYRLRMSLVLNPKTVKEDVVLSLEVGSNYYDVERETLPLDEFEKPDIAKAIVYDFLQIGNFKYETMQAKQLDFKGLDPDGYFEVLKLHPLAFTDLTNEEAEELLNRVYRLASRKYHSDKGGNDEMMKKVNAAREFFKDHANRKPQG